MPKVISKKEAIKKLSPKKMPLPNPPDPPVKPLVKKALMVFAALTLASPAFAEEVLTLTAPETKPSITNWRPTQLHIIAQPAEARTVTLVVEDTVTHDTRTCMWDANTTPTAATVISTLNTANLTSNSLQKRAMTAAQNLGFLAAGTVAGTPQ